MSASGSNTTPAAASFVVMQTGSWRRLHRDLAQRGHGHREAGAFLLAHPGRRSVRAWVAFDDLDPNCLTGNISFGAAGFSALWDLCDQHGLLVVADLHTHPGRGVDQSAIDRANPMISIPGHFALISPHYAQIVPTVDEVGVHVFAGAGRWHTAAATERPDRLRLRRLHRPARPIGRRSSPSHSSTAGAS